MAQVLEAGGPIVHATKADSVRLHDDKVGRRQQQQQRVQFPAGSLQELQLNDATSLKGVLLGISEPSDCTILLIAPWS